MRWLLFISRIALICNILFGYCWVVQKTQDFIHNTDINFYIITLGWFLAPFINLVANGWVATLRLRGKKIGIPSWLLITNLVFFIIQFLKLVVFA